MLRVAVPSSNQTLEKIISSFPVQMLVASAELIPELVRSSKVDVAFVPYSENIERKFSRRVIDQLAGWIVMQSENISPENRILLDAVLLRISTAANAKDKYLMRFVSSLSDEEKLNKLLCDACVAEAFITRNESMVRFETTIEQVAFFDIVNSLHEAGARQISLIPIEQYF